MHVIDVAVLGLDQILGPGCKCYHCRLQDANVFVSEADAGVSQEISLDSHRQAYLICIEGNLVVNEANLSTRDAIEIVAEESIPFPVKLTAGEKGSHFLLIEMQKA